METVLVPEFTLSVPVVVAIVALIRRGVPVTVPTWLWTWVALAVALGVAAISSLVGILAVPVGQALLNGLMVGLVAIGVYDGIVKPAAETIRSVASGE